MSCFSTIVRRKEDANELAWVCAGVWSVQCLRAGLQSWLPLANQMVLVMRFIAILPASAKVLLGGKKDLWKSSFILCLFNQFFIIFQLSYWHLKLDALTYFNGSIVPCYSKGLFYTLFLFVTLSWFQKFHYSHIWHECFCCMRFSLYH